jgi:phosphoribosyl 1,2-cyclic phosphodiesterase
MSLFITSLNSGSNGNCYYISDGMDAVLVDAGLSCRELEKRMQRLSLSMQNVRAVFISHEHADHIFGLPVIIRKYKIPAYITQLTLGNSRMELPPTLVAPFRAHEAVTIGGLQITGFPKLHDARDPHSFVIDGQGLRIGVFTDIGEPCDHVRQYFSQCHAAILEANYDDAMLDRGRYPHYLKQRIRSSHGHLSNAQALELFQQYRPEFMSHLLLGHLSRDNNDPALVQDLFEQHAAGARIVVASRYAETEVFEISPGFKAAARASVASMPAPPPTAKPKSKGVQMRLF